MKKMIVLSVAAMSLVRLVAWELHSPDGRLVVKPVDTQLEVSYDNAKVLVVSGFPSLQADAQIAPVAIRHQFEMPVGEWSKVDVNGSALAIPGVEFRIYNEGFAWLPTAGKGEYTFDFAEDATCWPVSHAQGRYLAMPLSKLGTQAPIPGYAPVHGHKMINYTTEFMKPGSCEAPLVVETSRAVVSIEDAAVYGRARMRYMKAEGVGRVTSYSEGPHAGDTLPWQLVRVAKTPTELYAGNVLQLALAQPTEFADVSFVKPGRVLRLARLDTETGFRAVDFIVRHHMQYLEIDSGWYGQEHSGDPCVPGLAPERVARGDQFDLMAILKYAKSKNVPVILYINRYPLEKNYLKILDTMKEWGVAGIKYGFLEVGSARARSFAFDLIREAAARGILVDIHDEMRLTGEQRTYPNVMTVEGIHGNEEMPPADHNAALIFTRYLTGPGDYTPCWKVDRIKTTLAHQLALAIATYSPWQFLYWYSRPEQIADDPALALWDEVPTVWDETRALQGEIGKFAVMARRSGDRWYVGGLNGLDKRTITIGPEFLGDATWNCRIFRDADPDLEKGMGSVAVETREVKGSLSIPCAARGGFSLILEKK